MKKYLFFLCLGLAIHTTTSAQNGFADANALYDNAKYKEAAELYRQTAATYPASAEIWYNLGNAYYKSGKLGFSVAAYRKALKLAPTDKDVRNNLDFVFAKTSDKIEPPPHNFIVRQTDRVADLFTPGGWALVTLLFALVALGLFLLYIFMKNYRVKKLGLFGSALFWISAFGTLALAAHRYYYALDSYVVVIAKSADVLGEPTENGTRLLLLNEGATLQLKEREDNWIKVELPNGSEGYVMGEKVEVI